VVFDPTATSTLTTYLNQWVKIASGDRVTLNGGTSFSGAFSHSGYLIFRCSQCKDNWHVGLENFSANRKDAVPAVLQDWVKKHRHVCKKFVEKYPPGVFEHPGPCVTCKWPYGAHEESWMKDQVTAANVMDLKGTSGWPPVGWAPATKAADMTLKQFTGRKFRDIETEEPCGSPDTNTQKTSTD
jgi:hypothetical protein